MNLHDIAPWTGMPCVRENIIGIDQNVPVLCGKCVPYVNLDNAASTPVLREVLDAVNRFMPWYSSVHRGTGFKSRLSTQVYEDAREIVADFVGANAHEHIVIFGKNTTEAINKLSYRLPLAADDVVLVSMLEHHSNDLPWRARAKVEHIGVDDQGALNFDDLDRLLRKHKGLVKLLAISGASNVTGYLPDIHRLAKLAHRAGAQILVDCAQLAPHRRIEMGALCDPAHLDYVALSAHKMYAPFGSGALIGRRDTFEQGEPEYRGGGTIDFVALNEVAWAAAPDRDEAGSPNVVGAVALASAIKIILRIGMQAIQRHENDLTTYALKRLADIEELQIYGDAMPANAAARLGVIPFNLRTVPPALVASILGTEFGIGVRHGCFCAHPYVTGLLGTDSALRREVQTQIRLGDRRQLPGMVRISLGLANHRADVDALATALRKISVGAYQGTYSQDRASGEFHAQGWSPDNSHFFDLASKGSMVAQSGTLSRATSMPQGAPNVGQ
jgi:cysteine desulfurase / selenocysteine lyase